MELDWSYTEQHWSGNQKEKEQGTDPRPHGVGQFKRKGMSLDGRVGTPQMPRQEIELV